MHQNMAEQIDFKQSKGKEYSTISRIKANALDSAAFDDDKNRFFTWGSFGNLRMLNAQAENKWVQGTPKQAEILIMKDSKNNTYAVTPDNTGSYSLQDGVGNGKIQEKIDTIKSIDWGVNHCVFVDKKNRVFTLGQNRYGKLGHGKVMSKFQK